MTTTFRPLRSIPLVAVAASLLLPAVGQAEIFSKDGFRVDGDFRLRLEADFDSQRADGTERDDRNRARVRVRLGMAYQATDHLSFGLRVRSGSDANHQSGHVTIVDFSGNDTGDADFNFDKWYAQLEGGVGWAWAGRNSLPFWQQNVLFWDDDTIPVGLGFGLKHAGFQLNGGYFSLPVGMRELAGNLGLLQAVYSGKNFTVAGGVLAIDADPADPDAALLLNGNGGRDYTVWVADLQAKFKQFTFGLDYAHNSQSYSVDDPDPFTAANRDEIDAYVVSIKYGSVKAKGDWQAAYYWAHVETLAVSSSYAQDDWVRWGSGSEVRATNIEGHELRFVYGVADRQNLTFRLYLVEAITTDEDGKRFRIDYNVRF